MAYYAQALLLAEDKRGAAPLGINAGSPHLAGGGSPCVQAGLRGGQEVGSGGCMLVGRRPGPKRFCLGTGRYLPR